MPNHIELAFRPIILTGETEQFEQKGAETSIGWLLLDILGECRDRG